MFDNTEELLRKIQLGEDTSLKLKEVFFKGDRISGQKREELADEIAAIANTHDGVVILGVDDKSKEITGIPQEKLDLVEKFVYEICNESIKKSVMMRTFRLELPNFSGEMRAVLKVEIPQSLFVHESPGGYFYRQGSSKRKIPAEYLERLFLQRSQTRMIRFEEHPVRHASENDVKENLWRRLVKQTSESDQSILLKRGVLSKSESDVIYPTVAGLLMCCDHPENFLLGAWIEAVRYRGVKRDSNYQIDAQKISGPLDAQVNQTMAFLKKNQTIRAHKSPHRIEQPQFSERAVFEAIVNAVAHRDYSIHGSKIRFFMFDDRLELYSPGSLPNTVTVDSMALRQATRNELITRFLSEIPLAKHTGNVGRGFYMEKRGEGVPIIFDESEKLSGKKPCYKLIDDSELLLTIPSAMDN